MRFARRGTRILFARSPGFDRLKRSSLSTMTSVSPLPLFADNYCWKVENEQARAFVLVDAADADPCLELIARSSGHTFSGILTTHFHKDHSGGNAKIIEIHRGISVVAGEAESGRVPAANKLVHDGDTFEIAGMTVKALYAPCHTRGHVCYFIGADQTGSHPIVFTGDTLFAAGCGRFFEGDAATMATSLAKLASLPAEVCTPGRACAHTFVLLASPSPSCPIHCTILLQTRVYCGHEYTIANLQFCLHVEPTNVASQERMKACQALRAAGRPTLPSTIGEELATNVFLRCGEASVQAFTHPEHAAGKEIEQVEVLARLREAKNNFKA